MTSFELIDNPLPDDTPEPGYCGCVIDGPHRNVVVDINEGRITTIICSHCEYPILFGGLVDDFAGVYANGLMLAMTTTVDQEPDPRGFGTYEPIDVTYHELTAHEGDE